MTPEVLILGGGPAGLATALELARRKVSSVVVERSAYDDLRVGEHLTPAAVLRLKELSSVPVLSADAHGESAGVTAYWGSEEASHTDYFLHPGQHGLNLSRPRFDADLARAAEAAGVKVLRSASPKRAERAGACWNVEIECDGRVEGITVPFIVDATGRAAAFSRRQGASLQVHDRQVAVVALMSSAIAAHSNTRSLVETAENGWWYCAPINATRSICMLATDHDLLPRGARQVLRTWWLEQLARSIHVSRVLGDRPRPQEVITRSARSQCLDVPFGSGWLAVGDAAMAFDPLASQGIVKALDHGRRAAASICSYLGAEDLSLKALALELNREFAAFQATRERYYRIEQRWPQSTFWKRRHTFGEVR